LRGFALRNWRVRSKLFAVVLIPTVAFAVLAGVNITTSVNDARATDTAAKLATSARAVTALVHQLQLERDVTAGRLALGPAAGRTAAGALVEQRGATDRAVTEWNAAVDRVAGDLNDALQERLRGVQGDVRKLAALRRSVDGATLTAAAVFDEYARIIGALIDVDGQVAQRGASEDLAQSVRAFVALSRLKEQASQIRGTLYAVIYQRSFGFNGFQQFADLRARRQSALDQFRAEASDAERALYADAVKGPAVLTVAGIQREASNRQASPTLGLDAEQWLAASTTEIELIRSAEVALLDRIVDRSQTLSAQNRRGTIVNGIVIAVILMIALLASLLVARSMVRHLRRLRASALDVAENRLPGVIQRLRSHTEEAPEVEAQPLLVSSSDEIGDVARAFDAVHHEAVRLATEQAALRRNVNGMFVNLARRSQVLVERQLRLIDRLETHEEDPDQLENLFRLDHLATRMRRNDESLLVLAGSETPRSWSEAIPLSAVLRAAASEVEHFTRIKMTHVSNISIVGHAAADIVHLLAELLENATAFSPPTSTVMVTGRAIRGGTRVLVEIEDVGVGMTPEALAEANRTLAEAPMTDVSFSERMGLYVVSRLAARHNAEVQLRESPHAGIVASVSLPGELVAGTDKPAGAVPGGAERATAPSEARAERLAERLTGRGTGGGSDTDADTGSHPRVPAAGRAGSNGSAAARSADREQAPTATSRATKQFDDPTPTPSSLGSVSAWFADPERQDGSDARRRDGLSRSATQDGWASAWQSSADDGWARAAKARQTPPTEVTGAGLPLRVPGAQYVPGSAARRTSTAVVDESFEADEVRSTLSSLYQGVEQAREEKVEEPFTATSTTDDTQENI
jgi:hypothetical protein